jgi:hypothetical protein
MSFWDWIFGRGRHVPRRGPAHSSDRHGFWRDLWQLRRKLNIDPEHSGSVDVYDHFGCAPWNDNDVKRERRDRWRPLLQILRSARDEELAEHAEKLLEAFEVADEAKLWRQAG